MTTARVDASVDVKACYETNGEADEPRRDQHQEHEFTFNSPFLRCFESTPVFAYKCSIQLLGLLAIESRVQGAHSNFTDASDRECPWRERRFPSELAHCANHDFRECALRTSMIRHF